MIIDLRNKFDFDKKHIPGSVNITFTNLKNNPQNYLDKLFTYYLICENGDNSKRLESYLNHLGYKTKSIQGGIKSIPYLC